MKLPGKIKLPGFGEVKIPGKLTGALKDAGLSQLSGVLDEDTLAKLEELTEEKEEKEEKGKGKPKDGEKSAKSAPEPSAPEPDRETATASFKKAIQFLRGNATDRNYRYTVPWFLVIGDPGSGKSAAMANAGVNLLEEDDFMGQDELEWRFLPKGILIGVPGSYFDASKSRPRDARGWPRLLRLLQDNRARRPIDGIILTIPATQLTGPSALEDHQLAARGNRIAEMLAQAQRSFGFSLPVYALVTKADSIGGFREFARELPAQSGDEIFGWSSPYRLDFSFSPKWVDEAFDSLAGDVHRLQSEIFAERNDLSHRDAAFLFPDELEKLRHPLRTFLERLFHETVYRESFKFRGLYFSGDISEPPREKARVASPLERPLDEWPAEALLEMAQKGRPKAEAPRPEPKPVKTPVFLKDLFEKKIFPEGGLASPLSRVALVKNRAVLAIQAAAALLALFLGIGTLVAYRRLSQDAEKVALMLDVMKRMPQIPLRERHNLLTRMVPASNANLKSPFMPTSLFSPTDGDITKVMTYACNKWVLETLRAGLGRRAQDLLEGQDKNAQPEAAPAAPAADAMVPAITNVEQLPGYQELDKYILELSELEDNIDAYEAIRQRGQVQDIERIRKLVQYLYSAQVDELRAGGHLAAALQNSDGRPFTPGPEDKIRATELMRTMIQQLFEAWFTNSLLLSDAEEIKAKIGDLEFGAGTNGHDALKAILTALKQTETDFASPGLKWVNSPTLDLNGPFRRVILTPLTSPRNRYLDPELLPYAKRLGEEHLRQLRATLGAEGAGVTGPLLDMKDPIGLSEEAKTLRLLIENTMNLPFMGQTGGRTIRTAMDPALRLIWRPEPLQDVLRQIDIYSRYSAEALTGTRDRMRVALTRVALGQLRRTADDRISQAQDFQGRPLSGQRSALSQEDETLPEVNSFREVVAPLTEIASKFRQFGVVETYGAVIRVLGNQAWEVMALLDRRLDNENPYKVKDSNFDAWNGRDPISVVAFEANNQQELGNYLDAQRERIKVLAQQADPLVQFLNTWYPTRGEEQNRTISRWQGIIGDFQQYEARKPGASLAALQDFILNEMDKITPDTDCLGGGPRENRTGKMDYFRQIRAQMRQGIMDRCRSLTSDAGQQSYMEIAALFNQKLAGNFPFAPLLGPSQPEALPEDVLEFYRVMDRNGKVARATLNATPKPPAAAALQFLDQMEKLRPLVADPSPDAEKEPPFTLDFTPRFRVNRQREVGGIQMIDWTLQAGGQLFHLHEPDHPGRWRYGNPVRFSLRWATDAIYVPAADSTQPNLRVGDHAAIFEFSNKWAMLSLLRRQEAPASDGGGATSDTKPYLLRFRIPTRIDPTWARTDRDAAAQTAVVYAQARVSAPGAGAKGGIVLPAFPVKAPVLPAAPQRRVE
jgi:type VI secretion system protein ImpL